MKIISMTDLEDGGLRVVMEIEPQLLVPLAALGMKHALVAAAMAEVDDEVGDDVPGEGAEP